jgi:hypothetical protein
LFRVQIFVANSRVRKKGKEEEERKEERILPP